MGFCCRYSAEEKRLRRGPPPRVLSEALRRRPPSRPFLNTEGPRRQRTGFSSSSHRPKKTVTEPLSFVKHAARAISGRLLLHSPHDGTTANGSALLARSRLAKTNPRHSAPR